MSGVKKSDSTMSKKESHILIIIRAPSKVHSNTPKAKNIDDMEKIMFHYFSL